MSMFISNKENKEHSDFFFRSKTESCWAYIFVNSGVSIDYEPEIYKTRHGGYCPDFYCPEIDMIFEVKGKRPTDKEIEKLVDVERKTGKLCAFLCEMPKADCQGVYSGYFMLTNGLRIDLRMVEKCYDISGVSKVVSDSKSQWHSLTMVCVSMVGGFDFVPTKSQGRIQVMSDKSNWVLKTFVPLKEKMKNWTPSKTEES